MDAKAVPGPQERRFAAYIEGLAKAAGHADRNVPWKNYCTGLLLLGERKSVEPMAGRLAPSNVRRMHQSLHRLVADAPWSDEAVLDSALDVVLPAMLARGPVVAWVVDDTGLPKKGRHSVGVARQYCGQIGKPDNCQVAVSLSVTTETSSMPIAYRLDLPEVWASDSGRREKVRVPAEIQFRTKLGIQSTTTVWKPGQGPKPAPAYRGTGRPPRLLRRDQKHQPVSVKDPAMSLESAACKTVAWRQGVKQKLRSRFAAMRIRPAHRDYWRGGTTSGGVAAHGMAEGRSPTDQIPVLHAPGRDLAQRVGANRQAPLDGTLIEARASLKSFQRREQKDTRHQGFRCGMPEYERDAPCGAEHEAERRQRP